MRINIHPILYQMKTYALIHAKAGLSEGYSDTTVEFFRDRDVAIQQKLSLLSSLMELPHESIESTTNGMRDVITFNEEECEEEVLQVVEIRMQPYPQAQGQWFIWDQINSEPDHDHGQWLDSLDECDVIRRGLGEMQSNDDTIASYIPYEFVQDVYTGLHAMLDLDDVCLHFFKVKFFH